MIKKTKSDTLRVLKNTIHYLSCVDIVGEESIEVAECLLFLKSWAAAAGMKKIDLDKFRKTYERKKK